MKSIDEIKENYNKYIEQQILGYEMTAGIIGYAIEEMRKRGIIAKDAQITGRIKSFKSAYSNYQKDKKIDDCFGIRIMSNDDDLQVISRELSRILVISSTKDHRKRMNTGYNAVHQMAYIRTDYIETLKNMDSNLFPLIEIQYWNKEVESQCLKGNLSYANYKHTDIGKIAERYKEDPESVYDELPLYYEIKGNVVKQLNKEETLNRLYPELQENLYQGTRKFEELERA